MDVMFDIVEGRLSAGSRRSDELHGRIGPKPQSDGCENQFCSPVGHWFLPSQSNETLTEKAAFCFYGENATKTEICGRRSTFWRPSGLSDMTTRRRGRRLLLPFRRT